MLDEQTCDVQMRMPVIDPDPIVVNNWKQKHEHRIESGTIPNPPPVAGIRLRLRLLEGFPATSPDQGDPDALAEDEQLLLEFSTLNYAGVAAVWEAKGKNICIYVTPGFSLAASPDQIDVLSRAVLDKQEKELLTRGPLATNELHRRRANRSVLQQRRYAIRQRVCPAQ